MITPVNQGPYIMVAMSSVSREEDVTRILQNAGFETVAVFTLVDAIQAVFELGCPPDAFVVDNRGFKYAAGLPLSEKAVADLCLALDERIPAVMIGLWLADRERGLPSLPNINAIGWDDREWLLVAELQRAMERVNV